MKELHSDILIIGGGLTGLMAGYALSSLKKNIIIICVYFVKVFTAIILPKLDRP